ncbi:hypothetical protein D3C73_692420 [compost metagenome]
MRVLRVIAPELPAIDVKTVCAGLLHLRIAPTQRNAQLRPGFHHPQPGYPEIGIVGVGVGNQTIQHRVTEHLPPALQIRMQAALTGLIKGRGIPLLYPRLFRRLKIRPQTHAAGQAKHTQHKQSARSRQMHACTPMD